MKSPFTIFAVAIMQILLVVILLPIIGAIFLLSLLSKKIKTNSFLDLIELKKYWQNTKLPRSRSPKSPKKSVSSSSDQTLDVAFSKKK